MTPDEYCREIEAYLCRKNDGHLIRIVGPSFERVTGWAERGVPLKVAFCGIDRYVERYYARGPRRRPVRIDFCEADVLDVFDEWRRAVWMLQPAGANDRGGPDSAADAAGWAPEARESSLRARPRTSLPAHLDRVILKLTLARAGARTAPALDAALERAVRELDRARAGLRSLKGEARTRLQERLQALDGELLATARAACATDQLAELRAEAEGDLIAFRARMPDAAYERAVHAAVDRLVRDRFALPTLAYD